MKRQVLLVVAAVIGLCLSIPGPSAARQAIQKLVPPVRGDARVEITRPSTQVVKGEIVTTIFVKNLENSPIAGFKVDENWYDKAGNPVGGNTYRHARPIQPGEVISIVMRMPKSSQLDRSKCGFTHANGSIKQTVVPKLAVAKVAAK